MQEAVPGCKRFKKLWGSLWASSESGIDVLSTYHAKRIIGQ